MLIPIANSALKGRLLVAATSLIDPNFFRTVVLILDHGDEGAVGVVLNRPSTLGLAQALPEWAGLGAPPAVVFQGGPVDRRVAIGLARFQQGAADSDAESVLGSIRVLDLGGAPNTSGSAIEAVRIFSGYAGWGRGQLEGEILGGGWFVVAGAPGDVLSAAPAGLWAAAVRRPGGRDGPLRTDPARN